jgi:nitronate monooxygenase
MRLDTRLTRRLGLRHPVLSAPMAGASGGALAAAVSDAGGLGLIGGGYGDGDWLDAQFAAAGNRPVGCGFITWSLARKPDLLARVLDRRPRALMLSFGDPAPFAPAIRQAGVPLICQVQDMAGARQALAAGADIIVAQGGEAGGHGAKRGTLTLVPEIADHLASQAPDTLLLAAGGIADGRGLAAALMLGADGVLVGTRFWATREALVAPGLQAAALEADGDATLRGHAPDVARGLDWPAGYSIRVLHNAFMERWHGREPELKAALDREGPAYAQAARTGDPNATAVIVGEATGLIRDVPAAASVLERMVAQAVDRLGAAHPLVTGGKDEDSSDRGGPGNSLHGTAGERL